MTFFRIVTRLALASSALAVPLSKRVNDTQPGIIRWGPCDFESANSGPIDCGTLDVPLDYTNASSGEKLTLSLIRSPSRSNTTTVKKSILFNFGGPGAEAVQSLNGLADFFHLMTGGQYDLVAFDPRGTAKTLTFSCFDNSTDRLLATNKYPFLPVDAHETALAETYANAQVLTNICHERNKGSDAPEFIGTAFVARDLMSVLDALGEDGLLRFWGLSYGSLLGATVAAMFPTRIDRLVLDGVVNAHNYYHHLGIDIDQLLSADAAFRAILSSCLASGPSKCALASLNHTTPSALETALFQTAASYAAHPVAAGTTTVITSQLFKELLFVTTKYPWDVATAAKHVANLVTRTNLTEAADYYTTLMSSLSMGDNDAHQGIKCSDTFPRVSNTDPSTPEVGLKELMPDVEHMLNTSTLFGAGYASLVTQCATWPWEARERYAGGWGEGDSSIKTKMPVLLVGNTYDPVTPLANAKNMSGVFEGSVVLEQRGFGHGTVAQLSDCTTRVMQAYFVNGTLPENGTACEVNDSLFREQPDGDEAWLAVV